jgi:hypothetical protein
MATFPELIPSSRTYLPGAYPHTAHRVYDGSEVRVRHSSGVLGVRLRLFFPALTTVELLLVIAHYNGKQGRFLPFAIPDELLSGTTTPADFTPVGHQWRYAAKPSVEDISVDDGANLHNLTVELETVPPENTIVQGARLRVRATLQAGSAQLGIFLSAESSLAAGGATTGITLNDLLTVTATLAAGPAESASPLTVTASLAAGVADDGGGDPDFGSVSLLLPMDGTNGSTTFTDASSNALTVTGAGNAQISTAQSQWGGASLLLDGSGDYLDVSGSSLLSFPGAFSIQGWLRMNNAGLNFQTLCELGDYTNGVLLRVSTASGQGVYVNNTNLGSINTSFSSATWAYVSLTRNGSNLVEVAVDGTVVLSATVTGTVNSTNAAVRIGEARHTSAQALAGYIDDLRITKGVARAHTPPTGPFPTS